MLRVEAAQEVTCPGKGRHLVSLQRVADFLRHEGHDNAENRGHEQPWVDEDADDKQALRAAEEAKDPKNPIAIMLADPSTSIHAKWLPPRKYYATNKDRVKEVVKGFTVSKELGVHEGKPATKGGE